MLLQVTSIGEFKLAKMKKIRITVETDSVLLVRRRRTLKRVWCEKCADFTECASFQEAYALTSSDANALTELIRSDKLHLVKTPDEAVLVCFLSLLKQISRV